MEEQNFGDRARGPKRKSKLLLETLLVAASGLAFALAANQISPRGLSLMRNYFPGGSHLGGATPRLVKGSKAAPQNQNAPPNVPAASEAVASRLKENGLMPIDSKQAINWFHDPQYEQELIVFVDARDDPHYQASHIPGAYQFDRYYPQNYLPAALPACLNAIKVVVYCTGGNCEDSEFAALALKDAGVPAERLFVYTGGISEWSAKGLPVETGERKSGNVAPGKPF